MSGISYQLQLQATTLSQKYNSPPKQQAWQGTRNGTRLPLRTIEYLKLELVKNCLFVHKTCVHWTSNLIKHVYTFSWTWTLPRRASRPISFEHFTYSPKETLWEEFNFSCDRHSLSHKQLFLLAATGSTQFDKRHETPSPVDTLKWSWGGIHSTFCQKWDRMGLPYLLT